MNKNKLALNLSKTSIQLLKKGSKKTWNVIGAVDPSSKNLEKDLDTLRNQADNRDDEVELKKLDDLQEKAEDLLHSDMIGAEVLKQISLIAKQTNINMTIPQNTVKELMNSK